MVTVCDCPLDRRRTRLLALRRKIGIVAFVLLCSSACTAVQSTAHINGVHVASSHELSDLLTMPGDQVVVVPNGVYQPGDIEAPHPATSGPLKGWLVLVAESPGGAVVDLSSARLWLGPDTTRVMFVGFNFVNGSVFIEGQNIDFWYTQHTYPATAWVAQSHDPAAPETGYYWAPRTIYVRGGSAQNINFYGTDVHDTGTGFSLTHASDVGLYGVKVWNITDGGLDPHDVIHPDALSSIGGSLQNLTVSDTWIRGRVMIEDTTNDLSQGGPVQGMLFRNTWVSNSPSVGFTFTSDRQHDPRGIFGAREGVRSWGSKADEDRTEIIDGVQYWYANTHPSRINVTDEDISTLPPPPGTISPPDQWRLEHPYSSWVTLFHN
jgi:hypothetical protein